MELDRIEDKKCPCGKGIYQIESYSDDWNRSEEEWVMICPLCKANYNLWSYVTYEKGLAYIRYLWIPKDLMQRATEINLLISKKKQYLISIAKKQYLNQWLLYFRRFKSKKAVWKELRREDQNFPDIYYPSLSTFYAHVKHYGIERYLEQYFSYENLSFTLEKLNVRDMNIEMGLEEINRLEKQEKEIIDKFHSQGFQ